MEIRHETALSEFLRQMRCAWVIAKKNARVYYLKGPVVTFGIVFPLFFYLSFAAGHTAPVELMVPGIAAMALFFTASAVGPLVTPWERQARTFERLVTSPASLAAMVAGDVGSGALFGSLLSLLPLLAALTLTSAHIADPWSLVAGWLLGATAFSSLGVLMASPATDTPSQIMMLSNLVRLPLIFVSGVFVPHAQMPQWGQWLSPMSPLSYCADLVRVGFGGTAYFSVTVDILALAGFTTVFMVAAHFFHGRTRDRSA
ncbi:MAG: ABC transporter permease [Comamonadaceae bacterium]|nr:MAG: ABC transporter permease [Comamonadaceae bacterium]